MDSDEHARSTCGVLDLPLGQRFRSLAPKSSHSSSPPGSKPLAEGPTSRATRNAENELTAPERPVIGGALVAAGSASSR